MAKFQVMEEGGFFDGTRLHVQFTEIDIPPEKYKAWVGRTMRPLDEEAARVQIEMRKHSAKLNAHQRVANRAARDGDDIPDPPDHPFEPKAAEPPAPEQPTGGEPEGKSEGDGKGKGKAKRASES